MLDTETKQHCFHHAAEHSGTAGEEFFPWHAIARKPSNPTASGRTSADRKLRGS
jgi:hypothetical protein